MAKKNHRIDLHYHIIPKPYVEALAERGLHGPSFARFPDWTPGMTLKPMDRNRTRAAVTSRPRRAVGSDTMKRQGGLELAESVSYDTVGATSALMESEPRSC